MRQHHVIARTNEQQHEYIDAQTQQLIATVTYHEQHSPRPFRLRFEAHVPNVSTSWHADLTRVNQIVDDVVEFMIH